MVQTTAEVTVEGAAEAGAAAASKAAGQTLAKEGGKNAAKLAKFARVGGAVVGVVFVAIDTYSFVKLIATATKENDASRELKRLLS